MTWIARMLGWAGNAAAFFAALLILFIVIGISISVAGRFFFNYPLAWMLELTEHALLCIPFLAMAWLARQRNGHVAIEIGIMAAAPHWQPRLRALGIVIAAVACAVMSYIAALTTWDNFLRDTMTIGVYPMPKWPFLFIIAFGLALTAIEFLRQAWLELSDVEALKKPPTMPMKDI
nr:TRAP transporter small permease [uncultured Roseovarius sp.]